MTKKKLICLIIALIVGIVAWCVPADSYGIVGLSIVEQRVIALFIFAALMWITEAVPIWTTSVLTMVLMLLTVSTSSVKQMIKPDKSYFKTKVVKIDTSRKTCPFVYWTKTDKKGNATDTLSASKVLLKSGMNEGTALLSTNEKYISFEIDKNCVRGALDKKAATYKSDSDKVYKIATVKDMKDVAIKISDSTAIMFTPATIKDMKKKANAGEQVEIAVYDTTLIRAAMGQANVKVNPAKTENIAELNSLGTTINYKDIMASFADPIIMLFMGGFILAIGSAKIGLDAQLAHVLLKPFGTNPKFVLLGFLVVTGAFSMFMSNTATAAMMLAILTPVLNSLRKPDGTFDKGCIGLALAIPVGANIGGIGTPIGTPPNAIALKYLNDPDGLNLGIGFGEWMMIMTPLAIAILFIAWLLIMKLFPFGCEKIELTINHEEFQNSNKVKKYIICGTFIITIALWATDQLTGINANVVALIPFAVFAVTKVITKEDLSEISWDVLWLVAGGFALGVGLDKTGLAQDLISAIPFGAWSPVVVLTGAGILCYLMATFMSHTATSALLMPIMFSVGKGMLTQLAPYGGVSTLLICVALSSSLAMALPISTPPNALAYSKGIVKQKQMAVVGICIGVVGLILTYIATVCIAGPMNIFN
jgi:sodium-dependent dicarboxylate transporter 2/3/5